MHRELLENLNLAALDQASERELREEIEEIATEYLTTTGIVLNREDRRMIFNDLYDEVKGLGPLVTLL
jgi:pilus assembly protein CpaF